MGGIQSIYTYVFPKADASSKRPYNGRLIRIDSSIYVNNPDCQNTIAHFQNVLTDIHLYKNADEPFEFIETMENRTVIAIMSGSIGQSVIPGVHQRFASKTLPDPDSVQTIFTMSINFKQSATSFASISTISHYPDENELLLSMLSVFRIQDIRPMDTDSRVYKVILTFIDNNDSELSALTKSTREQKFPNIKRYNRMVLILIQTSQLDQADKTCQSLLNRTAAENELVVIYDQLGRIRNDQEQYEETIKFYDILRKDTFSC
ncbi:unnamed protein product [Adineta ricciae]|uniref:Uncharacterized protein n=1 Tax=Adineta ricciae TaxID=249248 RepID=A0A814X7G2_ADIRI|nr:unnamed protein product [Adineta ricciae]CAF1212013.1 unnamed protein product [Adineta ricciae]